jgi:quercetin dioxygenase-like cupin family protein
MQSARMFLPALALSLVWMLASAASAADHDKLSGPISVRSADIQWASGPGSLPEGAEIAILEGDLTKAEQYTFRLRLPDGYSVPPHSHPVREHITVLQGTLMMGMGKTFDRDATKPLDAGSLFVLPVGEHHYVWTQGETVVQLHGTGPWGITYVNAADDPRKQAGR